MIESEQTPAKQPTIPSTPLLSWGQTIALVIFIAAVIFIVLALNSYLDGMRGLGKS